MSQDKGSKHSSIGDLLESLCLLPLINEYKKKKHKQVQLMEKLKVDVESDETIHSQYIDLISNKVNKEMNELEILEDFSLDLGNTLSHHEYLGKKFDSSIHSFMHCKEDLISALNSQDDISSVQLSAEEGEYSYAEVSSKVSLLNALFEEVKQLTENANDSIKELDELKFKLKKFQILPPDVEEIKQTISDAKDTINKLQNN